MKNIYYNDENIVIFFNDNKCYEIDKRFENEIIIVE